MGRNQREVNKIGYFFCLIIVLEFIFSLICALFLNRMNTCTLYLISKLGYAIPIIVYMYSVRNTEHFYYIKAIKPQTMCLTALFTLLCAPVAIFINLLSQELTTNAVIDSSDTILSGNVAATVLSICVITPILEELAFRGIIYNGLRENTVNIKAMVASAVLFGLIHMNFNQLCYAFILGLLFCILNVASGSIVASTISHITINSFNLLLVYLAEKKHVEPVNEDTSILIGIFFILTIISLPLVYMVINKIAKVENRDSIDFKKLSEGSDDTRVFTSLPILIGAGICTVAMILL